MIVGVRQYLILRIYDKSRAGISRLLVLSLVVAGLLINSGCSWFAKPKRVQVPQLLAPLAEAKTDQLVQEINRLSTTRSIHGKIDIQFEDTSFAAVGMADKYRQVDGTVTLQRPGRIHLAIQFSFVDLVQMTSDGERFRVAVLRGEEKYKRFVKGTNNAVYPKFEAESTPAGKNGKPKSETERVSALANLRPQHLTDALMIRPLDPAGRLYAQSEFFQEEPDTRAQAKGGARVMRGYYLLEELTEPVNGEARVLRRFWFDRVNGIRLARVQTYDDRKLLVTDVSYYNEKPFGENAAASLPQRVDITRPQDQYKLSISYQEPSSVSLNREWPPEAFVLENKWQLPEVDLDAQHKKVTANH